MKSRFCTHIIREDGYVITIYEKVGLKWIRSRYVYFGEVPERDFETTGRQAYQEFYSYAGKDEVEKMKLILPRIEPWDSVEQMHYFDVANAKKKIRQNIYSFDANSSFVKGVYELPKGFDKLKSYMEGLYEKKRDATDSVERSKYKNKIVYLIGYFARIKDFISTRSEIIKGSNQNISDRAMEIIEKGGNVYLSNTDSIVTDNIGADVMSKYMGTGVGEFKLEGIYDRLYYASSNCYQLNDKVVWSGVQQFARDNTDFINDRIGYQEGSLIIGKEYDLESEDSNTSRLCRVEFGKVTVCIKNRLGETLDIKEYKITETEEL